MMVKCMCLAGFGLLVALPSVGGVTLSEDFGGDGLPLGRTSRSFPAASLVGPNCGSIFFDIALDEAQEPRTGRRSLVCLRTKSRLSVSWASYGNNKLQFEFSDRTHCYYVDFLKNVEKGRTYRLGATWDGEAVRVYLDGRVIRSAAQPCAVKAAVDKLYLGPFEDKWLACKPWADDVRISNLRVWDESRPPQDVALDCGVALVGPDQALPAVLTVPKLADGVAAPSVDGKGEDAAWSFAASLPQLIECVDRGKSGRMPPHGFRVTYDDKNLYFLTTTLFPGRISYEEGVARTPDFEPETYSAESFEFQMAIGGHVYRFSANALGGTTERIDKDRTWNGPWTYSSTRAMQIDDSVVWTGEAAIPWTSLGFDAAPGPQEVARLNFARTWTLSTFGVESCLDYTGRAYAPTENCPRLVFAPAGPAYHLERRTDPAGGSYAEDFVLASGRKASVTYRIDLAKRDGSFAPMSVFSKGYQLEAGKPISETLKVETTVPGYDAIVHTLEENGEVVMRETVPYDLDEEIFTLTPLLLKGKLRVVYKRPFSGFVAVTDASGREVSKTAATGGTQVLAFATENAPGKYVLSLVEENGKTVSSRTFDYPGLGEWSRQDFHEDWILPPFSPMRTVVEKNAFGSSLALRVYGWKNSFLLNRVKSVGEDLFAAPPELLIGGEPVGCDSLEVVSNAPHHVGFVVTGRAAGASSRCSGWLEYDGVQFNRVTIRPDRATGEVAVRYRLKPAFGKYLHAAKGGSWGSKRTLALADGTTAFGAFPVLWIGNEEKGFCFFYETRADWTGEPTRTYDVEKSADGVTVTVHVAKALPAGKVFAFEFGFLASPVKPLEANHPFNAPSWSHTSVMNRPGRRPTADISALHCDEKEYPGGDLGSFFCDQDTEESRKVNARYRWTLDTYEKGNGTRPVSYSSARYLSVKYPEVAAYLPEWTFRPEIAMDYQHTGHYVYDCCPMTKANDFFIWKVKGLFKLYPELKGWFCDFGTIHGCSNEDHGCREKTPLLGQREFYRRLIVAQLEAGIKTPLLLVHNTDCVQLPALTFVTNLENGEHVRQASSSLLHNKKDILDTYGLEMFACELSSLPWGIANNFYMPYDTLSKTNGGDEETEPYQFRMGKASIGMGLVHHTMQELLRNHFGIFDKVFRIYDGFGVDKAKFTGYWRRPATVRGGKDVLVSCYARDGRVLAVIAHAGKEHVDQDVEIDFDFASLGLAEGPSVATDLLTAPDPDYDWLFKRRQETKSSVRRVTLALGDFGTKVYGFDGKTLRYRIPFHSFGIVELTSAKPASSFDPSSVLPKTSTVTSVKRCAAGEKLGAKAKEVRKPCTVVEWVSSPVPRSKIRCRVILPEKDAWNGMLYGVGGGGRSGYGYPLAEAAKGFAAAMSDLGSGAGQASNEVAMVDFAWRATHVMTVEAKKVIEAFYGRKIVRSVFVGGSTGGGQGIREASMFPDDYDGIVVTSPCINRINQNAGNYWKFLQTHGPDGTPLFDKGKCEALQAATIDWFADKDEPYCRGKFLSDTRYDRQAADGVLDLAAKRDAFFADSDVRARLHRLWEGPVVDGWRLGFGQPMGGRVIGDLLNQDADTPVNFCWNWHCGETRRYRDVTWKDFRAFAEDCSYLNMQSCDLSKFRDRGGKLIVIAGGTDRTVPQGMAIEWYERMVAETCGGDIEKAKEFARLYVVQLCGHGNGRCGIPVGAGVVLDWVEKDKAPGRQMAMGTDFAGNPQAFPVAVYPMKMSGSETDGWREVSMGRSLPHVADEWWYPRAEFQGKEQVK